MATATPIIQSKGNTLANQQARSGNATLGTAGYDASKTKVISKGMQEQQTGESAGAYNARSANYSASGNKNAVTPTVVSDGNIRDNVIPNIQKKAGDMLDYDKNPLYLRPGETPEAYKARTSGFYSPQDAQGGSQPEGSGSAPDNEYDSLYQSVMGTTPAKDDYYDTDLELLKQMQKTSDSRTSNQLASITSQFDQQRQDLQASEQRASAAGNTALMKAGSRYAPQSAAQMLNVQTRGFIREMSNIDLQESQAKTEAIAAQQDNDYKLLGQKLDILGEKRKEKLDVVNKMYDTIIEQKKSTQKDITDLVTSASKNGAPASVTNAMAAANSVGGAMEVAGDYLQTATGTAGEYLYYKRDALAHGQVPLSYNEYADMDANRKRSIVSLGGGSGLSSSQLSKVTTIADQFKNEQTVQSYQTIAQGLESYASLGDSPADDIQRIYTFAKTMDPNSAVREGEYKTVQEYAQAYLPTLGIKTQRLVDNRGFLTQEARNLMQTSLEKKFKPVKSAYDQIHDSYASRINKISGGEDGNDYLTDYSQSGADQLISAENDAQQDVIGYGTQNPQAQDSIKQLAGVIQPDLGRAYTWVEIKQILGI